MPENKHCTYCFINKSPKVTPLVCQSHDPEICAYRTVLNEAEGEKAEFCLEALPSAGYVLARLKAVQLGLWTSSTERDLEQFSVLISFFMWLLSMNFLAKVPQKLILFNIYGLILKFFCFMTTAALPVQCSFTFVKSTKIRFHVSV